MIIILNLLRSGVLKHVQHFDLLLQISRSRSKRRTCFKTLLQSKFKITIINPAFVVGFSPFGGFESMMFGDPFAELNAHSGHSR